MMQGLLKYLVLTFCLVIIFPVNDMQAAAGNGKTVLITGANRGIGLEFARQFKKQGYEVIGTARKPEEATELRELDARIEQLDVADSESVKAMAKRLQGVGIDILINNAGIGGYYAATFQEHDFDKIDKTFQVNSLGPMRVTQALYENLKQGKEKKILHVSSMMGSIEMNGGGFYGYRASKAALNMFNKTLSLELGKEGFICVVLHPGWVQTDLGGSNAPLSPEESIRGMLGVIEKLDQNDNGKFYDYKGEQLPW